MNNQQNTISELLKKILMNKNISETANFNYFKQAHIHERAHIHNRLKKNHTKIKRKVL